mmetsp:Transcript_3675/g.4244  ORF Transcript_3675/g.4244 Transcript_3675/m.4244 type:complete len:196 (-) Transcript_3675:163-750(-)
MNEVDLADSRMSAFNFAKKHRNRGRHPKFSEWIKGVMYMDMYILLRSIKGKKYSYKSFLENLCEYLITFHSSYKESDFYVDEFYKVTHNCNDEEQDAQPCSSEDFTHYPFKSTFSNTCALGKQCLWNLSPTPRKRARRTRWACTHRSCDEASMRKDPRATALHLCLETPNAHSKQSCFSIYHNRKSEEEKTESND